MMKNILVTGSNGFIGKALVPKLKELGFSVLEFCGDILDSETFNKFQDENIDSVVHLAGKSFVPDSWENPREFYETNVLGTQNVLDFCKRVGTSIVFPSSYMYGIPEYQPIDENHTTQALNPYAHSKFLAENLCEFYSKTFDVNSVVLRLFNVYGQNQSEHFLIPSIIKQIKEKGEITVKDLEPKRDYVHIDDVICAIVLAVEKDLKYEVFNIGSGKSYSVKEVIEILIKDSGIKYSSLDEKRPNEILDTIADISKAKKLLDWSPKISFEEGIIKLL